MRILLAAVIALSAWGRAARAQPTRVLVTTHVVLDSGPVADAVVHAGMAQARTSTDGAATLRLPLGPALIVVNRLGFKPDTSSLVLKSDTTIVIRLLAQASQIAPILVTSTRAERRLEEEPLRVEVLGGDDVGEKSEMRPADSRTLLSELSGVRVQPTSPLGASNVRIQGLPGRYTAMLVDGLPLFGGQAGSFSLVDVVPLDLRQAEVIKGAASALYGPQALGGVVNFVSRRPPDTSQVLINGSTPAGGDVMGFLAHAFDSRLGLTVIAGGHTRPSSDRDGDGWRELAGLRRIEARPRLFYDDGSGKTLMITTGVFASERDGGAPFGVPTGSPGPTGAFTDSLSTRHADAGVVGAWRLNDGITLGVRASATAETRRHRFGAVIEHESPRTVFGELSAASTIGRNSVVAGVADTRDSYRNADVAGFDAVYAAPGVFLQDTYSPLSWLSGTANGRCDWSNTYGTVCTPRLSVLARAGSSLTARLSGGGGWFAPTPLTDETQAFGLSRVTIPQPLRAERSRTASFDLTAARGPLQVNGTLFSNRVNGPVGLRPVIGDTIGRVDLVNATGPLITHGGELFAVFNAEPVIATAYYALTRSRETSTETGLIRELPLTPRECGGVDFALDDDESGLYGAIELFYTGKQALEDNPYMSISRQYTTVGVLLAWTLNKVTVFANGENLTNVRLTNFEPLLLPRVGEGGRWTVSEWAPVEGRRINVGVRRGW